MRILRQLPNDDAHEVASGVAMGYGEPESYVLALRACNAPGIFVLELDTDDMEYLADTIAILRAFARKRTN